MGGDYEKTVQDKKSVVVQEDDTIIQESAALAELDPLAEATLPAAPAAQQKIRVHISGSEAHFHDDDAKPKLKAAVPVADWMAASRRLKQLGKFVYVDAQNKTLLVIDPYRVSGRVDATITLSRLTVGKVFAKLDDFANRK